MMRRCAVPLAVAVLAVVALSGCKSSGDHDDPKPWKTKKPGDPPGLSPGMVQIMKTTASGTVVVGYATSKDSVETWFLTDGVTYPITLDVPNQSFTVTFIGAIDSSIDPDDNGVTPEELCAYPPLQALKPGMIWKVREDVSGAIPCQ